MIRFFDFVFRGIIVIGAFVIIFNNFRAIRRARIENENRKIIKYYHTVFNIIPIYFNYITSVMIGLSIFRVGSLLHVYNTGKLVLHFMQFELLGTEEVLQYQYIIIFLGLIGATSYIFLCILMNMSFLKLGKNFSVNIDIKEGNTLETTGVYGIIRHPIYLCEMLLPFAAALTMQNWFLIAWGLIMLPIELVRTKREDEMLSDHYGNKFENYKKDVNRFFPKKTTGKKRWIH